MMKHRHRDTGRLGKLPQLTHCTQAPESIQAPPGSQASSRGEAKDSALLSSRDAGPTSALWGSVTGSSPLPPPPEAANETARVSADPPNSALLLLVHLSHLQIGPGLEEIPESSKPARKVRSNNGGMGAGTLRLNPPAACFPVFLS